MTEKLTPKQEHFCQAFIETGNASEAYRQSYNAENMKPETVNRNAKALLDNNKIATRLEALQAEHRERHDITVDSLTADLIEDRLLARNNKQASAAISATMGIGRLHGLLVDKKELTGKDGGPIAINDVSKRLEAMTDDEIDARIAELMEKKNAA